ncbi:hypothetical protein Ciccas_001500 [Cichlidogyrus casuarinus]|uniref:Uncharacterized protein n=1 Tax=Cichlidogyrus casuarinus TaxID=1844966 RepID=A0ABD2QJU1_9PLAT
MDAKLNGSLLLAQAPLLAGSTTCWPFGQSASVTNNAGLLIGAQNSKFISQAPQAQATTPILVPSATSPVDSMQQAILNAAMGSSAFFNPLTLGQFQGGQNASNLNLMMAAAIASMCNQNTALNTSMEQATPTSAEKKTTASKSGSEENANEDDFTYEEEDELLMPRPLSASSDTKVKLKTVVNDLQSAKAFVTGSKCPRPAVPSERASSRPVHLMIGTRFFHVPGFVSKMALSLSLFGGPFVPQALSGAMHFPSQEFCYFSAKLSAVVQVSLHLQSNSGDRHDSLLGM